MMLLTYLYSNKKNINFIISLSLFFSLVPANVYAHENKKIVPHSAEHKMLKHAFSSLAQASVSTVKKKTKNGSQVDPVFFTKEFIDQQNIQLNEWKELEIPMLWHQLDRAQTALGRWALGQLLIPIHDVNEIKRRQAIIKALVEDEQLHQNVQRALDEFAKNEPAILSYYNNIQQTSAGLVFTHENNDEVIKSSQNLYFNIPLVGKRVNNKLNNSNKALETALLFDWGKSITILTGILCLNALIRNYAKASASEDERVNIEFKTIVKSAFKSLYDDVNPFSHNDKLQPTIRNGQINRPRLNHFDYMDIFASGTWGDKYQAGLIGTNKTINLFGYQVLHEQAHDDNPTLWRKCVSASNATLWSAWSIFGKYKLLKSTYDGVKKSYSSMEVLRNRMVDVARCFNAFNVIDELVKTNETLKKFGSEKFVENISISLSCSEKLKEIQTLLKKKTFKNTSGILYWRGRVLYAHQLIMNNKHEISPILRGIAELDAYSSIATLFKEHQKGANKFTFAQFVENKDAFVQLNNCWIAALPAQQAVANSISIGANKESKVVITGPNGGGKSTFIKALGQAVALAHSWGIVPAKSARLTLIHGMRSSLSPTESLKHGISKFMAQKARLDTIEKYVTEREKNKKYIVLLDEPYDGTVTDEIARRAGRLCNVLSDALNCLTVVATHIMPELNNKDAFSFYHVEITQPQPGEFKRTFKLKEGKAERWFNDAQWRGNFIDWLSKESLEKAQGLYKPLS